MTTLRSSHAIMQDTKKSIVDVHMDNKSHYDVSKSFGIFFSHVGWRGDCM